MANTIRIKRSTGNVAPTELNNAELGFTEGTQTLYYGLGVQSGGSIAAQIIAIGGSGAFVTLGTAQTIVGVKTFTSTITGAISGNAGTATTLATARNFSMTGDVTAPVVSFNGSGDVALNATLGNSGIAAAGTYTKVTVDLKGRVTVGAQASLNDLASPTAAFSMGGQRLTTLGAPTVASDAATKQYVDDLASGLKVKTPVRVATTAEITLANLQAVDGITLVAGDRVLVKNQTTAALNGVYAVVDGGSWTRTTDADTWDELVAAYVFVMEGTVNAGTSYVTQISPGGTLDTTAITWALFNSPSSYSAGNGLLLTGTSFSVKPNGPTITVGGDGVSLSATYPGQTSIVTVGTLVAGSLGTGFTTVGVAQGGTGATSFVPNKLVKSGESATAALTFATPVTPAGFAGDYLDGNSLIDGGTYL